MKNYKSEVEAAIKEIDYSKHTYKVKFETSKGDITLDLYPDLAPGHCNNIVALSQIGFYDSLIFHRVIKNFVIQGGCPDGTGIGGPGYNIDAEFNNEKHEPGVMSMARAADPNSAGSQIFLCTGTVPHLDGQYTVFGKTTDKASLDVVMAIGETETGAGDKPTEDMVINKASVIIEDK